MTGLQSNKWMNVTKKYQVFIDDNFHYADEDERIAAGSFASLGEAIERCKEITIRSLKDLYEKGMTPEGLHTQWIMFGDDPFIVGGDGPVPFSAREFISTELCKTTIASMGPNKT